MPGNEGQRFEIPVVSLGDIFTTQAQRDTKAAETMQMIPIEDISEFPNHPFRVVEDEELEKMAESIREYGVLNPAIVRPKEGGGYEMVSGHRRMRACELAWVREMPCIVRNLSDDEAVILMVDANIQRETVSPSEKAFAYKMKLEAIRRQAGRPNNSAPVVQDFHGKTSREIVAEKGGDSHEQVRRYIRLTELQPDLLQKVDESALGFRPAVELSYLRKEEQAALLEAMQAEERTPSLAQAQKMKQFSREGKLNDAVIQSIMQEEKPNQREKLAIPSERLKPFFQEGTSLQQMEETILKALEMYRQRQEKRRADNAR